MTISGFGGPEVFSEHDMPEPQAGEGQVIIDVKASSVNPIDIKIRSGMVPPATPPFRRISGSGARQRGSGSVRTLESKVDWRTTTRRIFSRIRPSWRAPFRTRLRSTALCTTPTGTAAASSCCGSRTFYSAQQPRTSTSGSWRRPSRRSMCRRST